MSVRPHTVPTVPPLAGSEGELVSVLVCIAPRHLERVLEILASLAFPINPQIYHQAGMSYIYPDGREELNPATIVEFPAFSGWLPEVRRVLREGGLPPECAHVRAMLEDIQSDQCLEAAPPGAEYAKMRFYKHWPDAVGAPS